MKSQHFVFTIKDKEGYVQYSNAMTLANAKKYKQSCENLSTTGQKFYIFKKVNI